MSQDEKGDFERDGKSDFYILNPFRTNRGPSGRRFSIGLSKLVCTEGQLRKSFLHGK